MSISHSMLRLPTFFVILTVACFTHAQTDSITGLKCGGMLEKYTDGVVINEATSIDVLVDYRLSVASINGWWGCLNSNNPNSACVSGTMPVTITDAEVKYYEESNSGGYSSISTFSINRYTGTFSVSSYSSASPQSGARWGMMLYSGKLNCISSQRQF